MGDPLDAFLTTYEIDKTVGSGASSKVKVATHIPTGEKVAVKIVKKGNPAVEYHRIKLEIELLSVLKHKNIAQMYQYFESGSNFYIIMEYCHGGELYDEIVSNKRCPENKARDFFRQIVSAVAYIHKEGVAHRDLKPENILLNKNQCIKLIDFGMSTKPEKGLQIGLRTMCGTPTYAAPEILSRKEYLGPLADIWSLGVILYVILTGKFPFVVESVAITLDKVLCGAYKVPDFISSEGKNLIHSILKVEPGDRISMEDLMNHPWFYNNGDRVIADGIVENELDMECLSVMAKFYNASVEQMQTSVGLLKQNSFTVTYTLLKQMKMDGRNVILRHPQKNCIQRILDARKREERIAYEREVIKKNFDASTVMKWKPDTKLPMDVTSVSERKAEEAKRPDTMIQTSGPSQPRRTGKRAQRPSLDDTPDVPLKMTSSQAVNRADGTPHLPEREEPQVAEPCSSASTSKGSPAWKTPALTSKSRSAWNPRGRAHKVLKKVQHAFTAKRKVKVGAQDESSLQDKPAILTTTKGLCNVSTTTCTDPKRVLNMLRLALNAQGIITKQKGFSLIGEVLDKTNQPFTEKHECKLSFELEVCLIPKVSEDPSSDQIVGIRRNRLKGNSWCYKKICEDVLVQTTNNLAC